MNTSSTSLIAPGRTSYPAVLRYTVAALHGAALPRCCVTRWLRYADAALRGLLRYAVRGYAVLRFHGAALRGAALRGLLRYAGLRSTVLRYAVLRFHGAALPRWLRYTVAALHGAALPR